MHAKPFELGAASQRLIEGDEVQGLRPVARREHRGAELHGVGSRERMDADEPFSAALHAFNVGDGRP